MTGWDRAEWLRDRLTGSARCRHNAAQGLLMKPKLLIVDDSKSVRLVVTQALKPFACEIIEAENGAEGLAAAGRERPDLLLLDVTMPEMDGMEMLSRLKSDASLKQIPVIMMTVEASRQTVLNIARMGVRDYLLKPVSEETLVDHVGRIINLSPLTEEILPRRRIEDPVRILVVDHKPAIHEVINRGLAGSTWKAEACATVTEALEFCHQKHPDVVLASLSLPDDAAFALARKLQTGDEKGIPVLGLCLKNASEVQNHAFQNGFADVITKPIDFEEFKAVVARSLKLDSSSKYFDSGDGVLFLRWPTIASGQRGREVFQLLQEGISEAVEAGLDKVAVDLSSVEEVESVLIQRLTSLLHLCSELTLDHRIIASEQLAGEILKHDGTKGWRFALSREEVLATWAPSAAPEALTSAIQ